MRLRTLCLLFLVCTACICPAAWGQTTTPGSSLAMRSTGSGSGSWTIDRNGYVGTYITLASPGNVTVGVNASGTASGGIDPHMNIVLADTKAGFDVTSGVNAYQHTFNLPAGTYFLRTEFNNDLDASARAPDDPRSSRSRARRSPTPAALPTRSQRPTRYIQNFRKGNVKVGLSGLAPGATVDVSLKRHAFNFGTAVPGFSSNDVNNYLGTRRHGEADQLSAATQSELQRGCSGEHGQVGVQRDRRATTSTMAWNRPDSRTTPSRTTCEPACTTSFGATTATTANSLLGC